MKTLRSLLSVANVDKAANDKLLKLTAPYSLKENPLFYAYNGAAEMTMANYMNDGEIDVRDFLDRADLLTDLGHTVLISNYMRFFTLRASRKYML